MANGFYPYSPPAAAPAPAHSLNLRQERQQTERQQERQARLSTCQETFKVHFCLHSKCTNKMVEIDHFCTTFQWSTSSFFEMYSYSVH
jgi:hypothetical protein